LDPGVEGEDIHGSALVSGALTPQLLQFGFAVSFFHQCTSWRECSRAEDPLLRSMDEA